MSESTTEFAPQRVGVLMGGWAGERPVSIMSGEAICGALRGLGHQVFEVDVTRNLEQLIADLRNCSPDTVFNALHGPGGEDGVIQGVLTYLGLPYTHSGVCATAICMNKLTTRTVLEPLGIPFADSRPITAAELQADGHPFATPYVLKPANEGSTIGVELIGVAEIAAGAASMAEVAVPSLVRLAEKHSVSAHCWMAEQYIAGRELTVGVIDGRHGVPRALAVTEIHTSGELYDYRMKYTKGAITHSCPADIPADLAQSLLTYAEQAHRHLGCRGVSRCDFLYDDRQNGAGIRMLEINAQPGLTDVSLVPEQALSVGMTYQELVQSILERPNQGEI